MATQAKRVNYTAGDKDLLVELAVNFKEVIECEATNKKSLAAKEEAWDQITVAYNSRADSIRTSKQLKELYKQLKATTKKKVAAEKVRSTANLSTRALTRHDLHM